MYDDNPKRFDRIVAILIQLQSKRVVKAQEMADRFGVSLRTIYRDIRTLEASGVPIYSEAGIGYSLMEGYRLPPVMFTREEVLSFIAAEKLVARFTDRELGSHYASAMFKLKAVLRSSEKDLASDIESKVLVRTSAEGFSESAPNALSVVFRAISEKRQIQMEYETLEASAPSSRTIEPIGVLHENRNWYVYAYCLLRNDYRQFRADRIHQIQITDQPFTREHDAPENIFGNREKRELTTIRILVDRPESKYLKYDRQYYGFVSEREVGDQVEMTFESEHPENGFARWYLMFADCGSIVEPLWLKDRIHELYQAAINRLK